MSPSTPDEALCLLDVIRENVEQFESIEAWEVSALVKASTFLKAAGAPAGPCESGPIAGGLARAFRALEPEVCDLTRMARLAELQLHKAIGDLEYEDGICVEAPDTEDAELATFAVSLLAEKVQGLKRDWYRLHDEVVEVARNAR